MLFSEFATLVTRTSDAIDYIHANPFTGVVDVMFSNGYSYEYSNVSRRAIINLIANPNMSLGFWVNANCVNSERAIARCRYVYSIKGKHVKSLSNDISLIDVAAESKYLTV